MGSLAEGSVAALTVSYMQYWGLLSKCMLPFLKVLHFLRVRRGLCEDHLHKTYA